MTERCLLWHLGNYYCLLYLQLFPLGCFPFALSFLCCFERSDVYAQCHVFSSDSGKGLPPAPLAMYKSNPSLQGVTFRKLLEISLRSPYSSFPTRALMLQNLGLKYDNPRLPFLFADYLFYKYYSFIPDLSPLAAITVLITLAFIRKMHFTFYHIQIRMDFFFYLQRKKSCFIFQEMLAILFRDCISHCN